MVIFSLLNWESKLLHRSHMLAKYFHLHGHKVFYVQKELSGIGAKNFRARSYGDNGINVVSLSALPYMKGKLKSVYSFNDWIMTKQLRTFFKLLKQPLIILESPYWIRAVNESRDNKGILCYDISDDFIQFATNDKWKKILTHYEKETINQVDYIFITAEELRKKASHRERDVFLVENGIDLKEFEKAANVLSKGFKRPICGFIGGLFQWVDFDLVEKLATNYPDYSFVLIGPTDQPEQLEKLSKKSNIYYLGEKDKSVIADYFASLDVGLIPFVSEERYPRLRTVNSNKVFQYCYFGYPVLSTEFGQVNELKDIIEVCHGQEEFIKALAGISLDTESQRQKRRAFALNNSWAKRVEDILKIAGKFS